MRYRQFVPVLCAFAAYALSPLSASGAGLRGSPSSMRDQHRIAVDEDLTFLRSAAQVQNLVEGGGLQQVDGNADFFMSGVSFPYARPETKLFIERIAAQYRTDTGEQLVVTSLTRPRALQPRNAHDLSVHPAGMAVDFRVPATAKGRAWLERALLGLEKAQVLDVTRERNPPHYHVAVFPAEYLAYAKQRAALTKRPAPAQAVAAAPSLQIRTSVNASPATDNNGRQAIPIVVALLLTTTLAVSARVAAKQGR